MGQEFVALLKSDLFLLKLTREVVDLGFRCLGMGGILRGLLGERVQLYLERVGIILR
jgi:hypothetical protein